MVEPYTRYFWKEITDDGRLIDAVWANPEGYEHSDQAICHFHYRFGVDPSANRYVNGPRWHLMKFYGLRESQG